MDDTSSDIEDTLVSTAHAFRRGNYARANVLLTSAIDVLNHYLVELDGEQVSQVHVLIKAALQAQQQHDYLHVADIFEYQLISQITGSGAG